ncbi:MAG: uracil-DNA glycosylase family protein [Moraxellaceae bacterium]
MSRRIPLLDEVRACTLCADHLPLGPRPILQFSPTARILIASQAPGRRVHGSGIPFEDASGDRLREWMGIGRDVFYDETRIAILPMGFCYPGKAASGDAPPRKECAPQWRQRLMDEFIGLELVLAIGAYSQAWHLPKAKGSLTERVKDWQRFGDVMPLPHPSPLNNVWLSKNRWFEQEVVPALQARIKTLLKI